MKWHFHNITATLKLHFRCFPLQLRWSKNRLQLLLHLLHGWCVTFFFSLSFCLIWGRIVELFCPGPISPHWGVLSKCLAYSKAASDPFVYSLLRHQYRKTCSCLANKILKRSPLNSSSNSMVNNTERSNANSSKTHNTQPPINKPPGHWRLSLTETILNGGTVGNKCAT